MDEQKQSITGRELKLAVATLLAAFYIAVWPSLRPLQTQTSQPPSAPERVWVSALPPSQQPEVSVPPGWVRANSASAPLIRPRVSVARPRRVRTRSS
mgnify:CR=1 FL=1